VHFRASVRSHLAPRNRTSGVTLDDHLIRRSGWPVHRCLAGRHEGASPIWPGPGRSPGRAASPRADHQLGRRRVQGADQPRAQVGRRTRVLVSDRESLRFTVRSGTQRVRRPAPYGERPSYPMANRPGLQSRLRPEDRKLRSSSLVLRTLVVTASPARMPSVGSGDGSRRAGSSHLSEDD
jgi:hypothetical protein